MNLLVPFVLRGTPREPGPGEVSTLERFLQWWRHQGVLLTTERVGFESLERWILGLNRLIAQDRQRLLKPTFYLGHSDLPVLSYRGQPARSIDPYEPLLDMDFVYGAMSVRPIDLNRRLPEVIANLVDDQSEHIVVVDRYILTPGFDTLKVLLKELARQSPSIAEVEVHCEVGPKGGLATTAALELQAARLRPHGCTGRWTIRCHDKIPMHDRYLGVRRGGKVHGQRFLGVSLGGSFPALFGHQRSNEKKPMTISRLPPKAMQCVYDTVFGAKSYPITLSSSQG